MPMLVRPLRRMIQQNTLKLLCMSLCGAMVVIGGVGVFGLVRAEDDVDDLTNRLIPAHDQLLEVDRSLLEAQLSLERAMKESDPGQRYLDLEISAHSIVKGGAAWNTYRSLIVGGEQVVELETGFETIRAAWLVVVTTLQSRAALTGAYTDHATASRIVTSRARFEIVRYFARRIDQAVYGPEITDRGALIGSEAHTTRNVLILVSTSAFVFGSIVSRSRVRASQIQQRAIEDRDRLREAQSHRNEFEARLHRALEMSKTEDAALTTITMALNQAAPGAPLQLLIADSSRAHLRQALTTDMDNPERGCRVLTPSECPAVNRGQTLVFETSASFDACPFLRDRGDARSAVCIPVSIMGVASGVLHTTGPDGHRADADQVLALEQIAAKAGERVGLLRVFNRSELQAATDPLTGLANRRSLEQQVQDLTRAGTRYSVAYGDLDRFKLLNDDHGHETGDRALRLFARVLQESVRDVDIVARWGGEEFIVILPSTSATNGAKILERVQEELVLALSSGTAPQFTVSFGVCGFDDATTLDERIEVADSALHAAKLAGRNRVVVAGVEPSEGPEAGTLEQLVGTFTSSATATEES